MRTARSLRERPWRRGTVAHCANCPERSRPATQRRRRGYAAPQRLGAVAALELLARTAPARVVAAELLLLRLDDRARRDHFAAAPDRCRDAPAPRRDRLGAGEGLVLIGEVAVRAAPVRARG